MKVVFDINNLDELSMANDCLKEFFDDVPYDLNRNIMEVYKPFSHNDEVLYKCKITTSDNGIIVETLEDK